VLQLAQTDTQAGANTLKGDAGSTNDEHLKPDENAGAHIGRYKLLEIIGEGGFGTVWMAEQTEPVRRRVALKIIKLGMDTRQVVARFEAERQALALMDHPNIARVLDAGATEVGRPYFVMELVRGVSFTEFCDARQLNTRERLELFIPVCQAVQHAHQKGVIHRDLKPSNILVTEQDGRPVPKIIDFGVAKAIEEPLTDKTLFTRFHQFLGTPAYMSPEQAGLGGLDVDTRSDIYSLGVLLYELLTGRTPFDAREAAREGYERILQTIREQEPPRPSTRLSSLKREDLVAIAGRRSEEPESLHKLVRGDLDWIVLKALEKDRARRYESANGLAADLRRYLENEPIAARPPSALYRIEKLARRNKLLFGAVAAVFVALVIGLIATFWQTLQASRNLAQARLNAYVSEMNVAQQALAENNLERALQLLDRQRPKPGERDDLRGFEWRYLWQLCQGNETVVFRDVSTNHHTERVVAFSPEGRYLAYGGINCVVIRDTKTLQIVTNLPVRAHALAFSAKHQLLVTSAFWQPGVVRFWDLTTWAEVRVPALAGSCSPAVFSPDGRWLVTGIFGTNKLQLWDTATWEPKATCDRTPIVYFNDRLVVSFSPDSKRLASGWMHPVAMESGVRLWQVPNLENQANLFGTPLLSAAFLPDSKYLLTGSWLDQLLVWNLEANPPVVSQIEREHSAHLTSVAVAPGARTFATASADQSVCLWDAATFKQVARWRGHTREIWGLAMSPDGETVASSSLDGTVRLWRGQPLDTGASWGDAGSIAGFSADGRTVVFGPREGDYRWQLVAGTNRVIIPIPTNPPMRFNFDHTASAVKGNEPIAALGRTQGRVELWDLAARRLNAAWDAGTNWVSAVAFSPDGKSLATGDEVGMVRIWNLATRAEITTIRASTNSIGALVFSPDGQLLATGSSNESGVWHWATRQRLLDLGTVANQIAFAHNGQLLAVCNFDGNEAQLWELPSGRRRPSLKGHVGGLTHVTFSPDGRTLATGAYDRRIKLWNLATSQEVATIPHPGMLNALRFSPDGRTLAASFWMFPDIRAELHRAPSLDEIRATEQARNRSAP
jgi:WD40 repeat protein/serine/threonine protein kinase